LLNTRSGRAARTAGPSGLAPPGARMSRWTSPAPRCPVADCWRAATPKPGVRKRQPGLAV